MKDVHISQNQMIQFPMSTGLTSGVIKSQKTITSNKNPTMGLNFINEVDNIKSLKEIRNIMFFALTREDGSSNGII